MDFANTLKDWYLTNQRDLPWRHTRDPYAIWLSEIILQQTRVAQGLPYYDAFLTAFPTVGDLAAAEEQQVLRLWQGLGYYSRARNLHETARKIAFDLGGQFPDDYKGLLQLKGVGDYTAAAIASFAYNEAVPVVDGNVFRVLARYFGIEDDIAKPSSRAVFRDLAQRQLLQDDPGLFNQSIMEFGALQCIPGKPDCDKCPLQAGCVAFATGKVALLPVKNKKTRITERHLQYLVPVDPNGKTRVHPRTGPGIWRNLYEFPLHETTSAVDTDTILDVARLDSFFGPAVDAVHQVNTTPIIHKLSHQHLSITFWQVNLSDDLPNGITVNELAALPFPIVLHNFIERHFSRNP